MALESNTETPKSGETTDLWHSSAEPQLTAASTVAALNFAEKRKIGCHTKQAARALTQKAAQFFENCSLSENCHNTSKKTIVLIGILRIPEKLEL
jgi:hypothetical protein